MKKMDEKLYRALDAQLRHLKVRIKDSELRKVCDEVFDYATLYSVYKLINTGVISTVEYPISTGKEGNVFKAFSNGDAVALKIYRISTATFKAISAYIIGDPRFKGISKNRRKLIYAWARKEFANLTKMYDAGVSVPQPIKYLNNILVMEYIGDEYAPAPLLKEVKLQKPKKMFERIIKMVKICYQKAGIVHTDLSEYNVLVPSESRPVFIDVAQGVTKMHPNALDFLYRDIANIVRYFKKYGIKSDCEKIFADIVGDEKTGR
jgi:RIO kinase 1